MIDPKKVKTYSVKKRANKVNVKEFASRANSKTSVKEFVESLPSILAAESFKRLLRDMQNSRKKNYPILWGLGAHVIKTGLSPVLIELMKAGYVNHIAMNGAGAIHDSEIAMIGASSEDVGEGIANGSFGMAYEVGELINSSVAHAAKLDKGAGEVIGEEIARRKTKYRNYSILYQAHLRGIPVSIHVAIGTDIIHMHPNVDPAAIGKASYQDFILFCNSLSRLQGGGAYLNVGSAVILPEVFLKAITVCRNQGFKIGKFTVASFDFIRQYRTLQNVLSRPSSALSCNSVEIIGHHEIMLPLLAASLLEET